MFLPPSNNMLNMLTGYSKLVLSLCVSMGASARIGSSNPTTLKATQLVKKLMNGYKSIELNILTSLTGIQTISG